MPAYINVFVNHLVLDKLRNKLTRNSERLIAIESMSASRNMRNNYQSNAVRLGVKYGFFMSIHGKFILFKFDIASKSGV